MTSHLAAAVAGSADTVPLATAGFRIPIWGVPILLIVALGISVYQKNRDGDR